jgi:hypothetical protein
VQRGAIVVVVVELVVVVVVELVVVVVPQTWSAVQT